MADSLPVSVVIPAYNRPEMVARAVRSALGQRPLPPAEVIVVDDCSTDHTGRAAREAGARVIRHERNRGEGAARNTGIAAATQPWIGLLDSDDEWLPGCLATLWPLRDGHILAGGAQIRCGTDPRDDRYAGIPGSRPQVLRNPEVLLYPENFIAASGTIVKRDVVRAVGAYAEGLRHGADLDLWLRVLERGTGVVVAAPVVLYHLHEGQVTNDQDGMWEGHQRIMRHYADRPWASPATFERWQGVLAWDGMRHAMRRRSLRDATRHGSALLADPRRVAGAAGLLVVRQRLRRRSGMIGRDGRPTRARLRTGRSADGLSLLDLVVR